MILQVGKASSWAYWKGESQYVQRKTTRRESGEALIANSAFTSNVDAIRLPLSYLPTWLYSSKSIFIM